MSELLDKIRDLLDRCTEVDKRTILFELREEIGVHPFEKQLNTRAEVILEALERAPDLTLRGIRGIIGEATFVQEVIPALNGWADITPEGNHSYDSLLKDGSGAVRVQVKLQRREKGVPLIKHGSAIVEVQRTRNGNKDGKATRPYRFGEFDILAVCMEPSHQRWDSFLYAPERWLYSRPEDPSLIKILQPVPLTPNDIFTDDFVEAVKRLRSGKSRPADPGTLI